MPNSLEARDIGNLVHPYTNLARHPEIGPLVIDRGEGIHVWDTDGKQYIEGVSGLWCASLGYGEKELVKAATEQMEKLAFSHLFQSRSHAPAIELAEKLKSVAPCDTARVFFVGDGSSANDTAIKLIWYYNNAIGRPEKKKIIGRLKAYHGVTVASASVTGLTHNHRDWDLPLRGFLHTDCPHYYREGLPGESEEEFVDRIIGNLERLIEKVGPDEIAAFFAEPIQGAGGLIVPPKGYFPKLQAVLRKHDILLVADEVITGFLRTGNYWGCQTVDMQPDMVTCAKALSSAYLPIGAVTIPSFMHDAMVEQSRKIGTFGHGNTYSGHPVCAAVALRTLQIYEERDLLAHVRRLIPRFQQRLAAFADHPLVGEARLGAGLMGGVELVADKATKQAFDPSLTVGLKAMAACAEAGLMVRAVGDVVILCPPLIITEDQVDAMFDRLASALDCLKIQ
ncbi:MAG: aminotransferase class III-fold pyridoxal phosphate-dependent enzyme [Alphaproteobacteria bacterium]|nr:aminotransferase class III-fold pyridoxal phosphate-dependent enzyme [Alphaproteobacteria bacterium]